VAAAAANTGRNRVMVWQLRSKQTLSYIRFRNRAKTNILHDVAARGQVRLPFSISAGPSINLTAMSKEAQRARRAPAPDRETIAVRSVLRVFLRMIR
jgi:hypothetical protein